MDLSLKYAPFKKQIEAHAKTEEVVGYFGGWGSGKTTWVIAEAFRNTCFLPGIPGILTSPTFPVQRKTLYPVIVGLFPGATRWPRGRDNVTKCLGPLVRDWNAQDRVLTLDIGDAKTPMIRGGWSSPISSPAASTVRIPVGWTTRLYADRSRKAGSQPCGARSPSLADD